MERKKRPVCGQHGMRDFWDSEYLPEPGELEYCKEEQICERKQEEGLRCCLRSP